MDDLNLQTKLVKVQGIGRKDRHSPFSDRITKSGGNISILQKVLGHSSLRVTQRYFHLSNEDMSKSYGRFSPAAAVAI